jgi:hypothetical protein
LDAGRVREAMMKTKVFYTKVTMTSETVKEFWSYSLPAPAEVERFCEKTAEYANANNLRVASITPISGALEHIPSGMGSTMTCGFVVVFEELR